MLKVCRVFRKEVGNFYEDTCKGLVLLLTPQQCVKSKS